MPLHSEEEIQQQEKIHKKKYEFSKSNQNTEKTVFFSELWAKDYRKGNSYLYFELI